MNRLGRTAGGGRNGGAMDGSGGGHPDPPARFPGGAASPHPAGAASLHPASAASPQPAGAASIQGASLRAAGAASPQVPSLHPAGAASPEAAGHGATAVAGAALGAGGWRGGHTAFLAAAAASAAAGPSGGGAGPFAAAAAAAAATGEWPDWWRASAAAAEALGPDWLGWLGPEAGATGGIEEEVPIVANPSRRRGGRGGRCGRGGRAPRPPQRAAPTDVDVDLTDSSSADWCDENTRIVCELFAAEVMIGNRDNTHLNKAGYKNVIEKFKQRTGIEYSRKQFKNKWDRLKTDYVIWKKLTKETGIGWDAAHTNIVMSEAWWKKTAKAIKGANRFKNKGLQNEDQLGIMFEDLRNTGDDHWSASTGVRPSEANLTREDAPFPVDDDEDDDAAGDDDDSEPEEVTPTSVRGKRARVTESIRGRKPKTATGQWFQQQMGKIVEMNERTTASCESIARREDTSGCSIQDVMALVKDCGATSGTNEHFIASIVFTKRAEREMFMTLDTAEERFQWLTKKYEWMTRND